MYLQQIRLAVFLLGFTLIQFQDFGGQISSISRWPDFEVFNIQTAMHCEVKRWWWGIFGGVCVGVSLRGCVCVCVCVCVLF